MVSALERQREENVRRNRELLLQLGLDVPIVPAAEPVPKSAARKQAAPRKSAASKRRISEVQDDEGEDAALPSSKRPAVAAETDSPGGARRSSRHAGKPRVSYTGARVGLTNDPPPLLAKPSKPVAHEGNVGSMDVEKEGRAEHVGTHLGRRVHDPKTYGSIPGVEVGTWWETRAQCSTDAIHAPFVAGISPGPQGAYSIALSGGYEDDVDLGYAFTYTGSGGRDLKGTPGHRKNLRTAPQSAHQSWENTSNAALKKSAETKKPVRVIRGFKLQSEWAPVTGYRYDGLYRVEKAWMEQGLNPGGFQVCKFALKRMDGQPALPRREPGTDAAAAQVSDDEDGAEDEDENEEQTDKMDIDSATTTRESSVGDGAVDTKATTPAVDDVTDGSKEEGGAAEVAAKPAGQNCADVTSASADDGHAAVSVERASTMPDEADVCASDVAVDMSSSLSQDGASAANVMAEGAVADVVDASSRPSQDGASATTVTADGAVAAVVNPLPSGARLSGLLPASGANPSEDPAASVVPVVIEGDQFPLSSARDEHA